MNKSVPSSSVKREVIRPPSPVPSDISTMTTLRKPYDPTAACSSASEFNRGTISIRPLSSLMDPDDQMSTFSSTAATHINPQVNPRGTTQVSSSGLPAPNPIEHQAQNLQNDWRHESRTVYDRLRYILEHDDTFQDIVFAVEGKSTTEQFKAHKLILRIASPVFDELFQKSDASCNVTSGYATVIPIPNLEPVIFKLLLNFIYTDQVDTDSLDEEKLIDLLQAALKFEVIHLYSKCVDKLKEGISPQIAVKLCETAYSFKDESLLELCMSNMARDALNIFEHDDFLKMPEELFGKLIDRNDLNIDEISLFEAAVRWAEYNCNLNNLQITSANLRKVLSNIILKIRFPLMNPEEFALKVVRTQILTEAEQVEIYPYFVVELSKLAQLPGTRFSTSPRCPSKLTNRRVSDTLSDFTESLRSNDSPERQGSLVSTTLDNTATEPESETASTVSSHQSESRKKPKKQKQSKSSNSGSKKRNKERHNSSGNSSKKLRVDDLFGDVDMDKQFCLKNKTISFKETVAACRRLANRISIEVVNLENVLVQDFKEFDCEKVHFPELKEFNLNIKIPKLSLSQEEFLKILVIEKLLFFTVNGKTWTYDELWQMNVSITVIINDVVYLRISHKDKHVALNKFSGIQAILKSIRYKNINNLEFSQIGENFNAAYVPTSLKKLTITGISSDDLKGLNRIIQQLSNLQELRLLCSLPKPSEDNLISWSNTLVFKDKLRKLSLGVTKISVDNTLRFPYLKKLYFFKSSWDQNFENRFTQIFPNLEEVYFVAARDMKMSPNLLISLCNHMKSVTKIVSINCDWRLAEMPDGSVGSVARHNKEFLISLLLGADKTDKYFVLRKTSEGWVAESSSKSKLEALQELHYTMFSSSLFVDIYAYKRGTNV